MKALVLAPFSDDGLQALRPLGEVVHEPWTETQEIWDPEKLGARLASEGFDTLVVEADFLFEELFERAPSLKFAALCRAALNQVDLDAATGAGVVIVHTPGRNAQAVAELVLGHMIGLARHIPQSSRYVADGEWEDPTDAYIRFHGRELSGATLGVIGLGQIGARVASVGQALGMRVLAHDPYVAGAGTGVELCPRERLLAESDFVSVHVPETDETTGMIGAGQLALMKPGSYLINVTSPAVVDPKALAEALRGGLIAGAAMDVHESHPIAPDSPLLGLPNAVLTPHIGGATQESIERHSAMVVDDLRLFLAGERPMHFANRDVWERRR